MNETMSSVVDAIPGSDGSARSERDSSQPHAEGVRDTIESILVALILAFVFRAFIIEAFIIPTGSMAPTLYGAHGTVVCDDCGTEFAYGLRDLDDPRESMPVRKSSEVLCPNCNNKISDLRINDGDKNPEKGDRILVLKWPYDLGIDALGPQRWDVVVFKDPADGFTNFIKRLAGMPNEVLMILDGDLYTVSSSELSTEALTDLERYVADKHAFRTGTKLGRIAPANPATFAELEQKLRIVRKTPTAQSELWHVVYDHDHAPRTLEPVQPRWEPGSERESGWDAHRRRISFAPSESSNDFVELRGKDIRAGNSYNVNSGRDAPPVSDQRVHFVWTPVDDAAEVRVRLIKQGRTFWAEFHADGNVRLVEWDEGVNSTPIALGSVQLTPFQSGRTVALSFENCDYHLSVQVSEREVLASSSDPKSAAYYAPNVKALRTQSPRSAGPGRRVGESAAAVPPRVYGGGGRFWIEHLVVARDEHYYLDDNAGLGLGWAPGGGWAGSTSPLLLRKDEYFMLGDNTSASKDSRLWDVAGSHLADRGDAFQLGTVPRDQLIGRAFFVYWPFGHRLDWLPIPALNNIGLIPDVGRMRWIR